MPAVPTYNAPQEQEHALPGVRQESIVSPGLLDAGAEQQGALGKGVLDAGSGLAAVAYHMEQRQNADVLFKSMAATKEAYIGYEAEAQKNRQGDGARGVTKDTAAWWKDHIPKVLDGMANDTQKRLYQQHATELQLQSLNTMSHFEVQQTDIGAQQNYKADKANTTNLVAANPSDVMVTWGTKDIQKKNAYMAAQKNWSPELLEAVNTDDLTKLHQQVIQTLAASNPDKAVDYFNAHKEEIAGSQRAEIGGFAEKATAAAIGGKLAQTIWSSDGPQNDTDASSIDKMKARAREELKDKPFALEAALHTLSQMDADRDKGVRARDNNRTSQVNQLLLDGKSIAAVQQTPAWAALDGTERKKIIEHEKSVAASDESRAYTAEVRTEHKLNTEGLDTMIRLSDPDKLVAMSRDEIINLRTTIGNDNTKSLLNKWDALTKSGTHLAEAKLDNDQYNTFAVKAGLNPQGKSDDDKRRIQEVRDQVERMIASEQQAKKRPLTRDEKDAIMQKQIDNKVIQHSSVWFDKSVPAITLPAKNQDDAYVNVGGQKVVLSSIPSADRTAIISARQKAGLPITEQAIADMYVRKNNLKKGQ
jgi:hypothetical protein